MWISREIVGAFVGFMYFDGNQCEWVWFCVFLERVKGVGAENLKFGRGFLVVLLCLVSWDFADLASPCCWRVLFEIYSCCWSFVGSHFGDCSTRFLLWVIAGLRVEICIVRP
jgi:hypothetical protein